SSRRRHTRFSRDWSSDVCSSDLVWQVDAFLAQGTQGPDRHQVIGDDKSIQARVLADQLTRGAPRFLKPEVPHADSRLEIAGTHRSEERRVGKVRRARWMP